MERICGNHCSSFQMPGPGYCCEHAQQHWKIPGSTVPLTWKKKSKAWLWTDLQEKHPLTPETELSRMAWEGDSWGSVTLLFGQMFAKKGWLMGQSCMGPHSRLAQSPFFSIFIICFIKSIYHWIVKTTTPQSSFQALILSAAQIVNETVMRISKNKYCKKDISIGNILKNECIDLLGLFALFLTRSHSPICSDMPGFVWHLFQKCLWTG